MHHIIHLYSPFNSNTKAQIALFKLYTETRESKNVNLEDTQTDFKASFLSKAETVSHTRLEKSHDRGTEQSRWTSGERQEKEEWKQRSCHQANTKETRPEMTNGALQSPDRLWLTEPCRLLTFSGTRENKSHLYLCNTCKLKSRILFSFLSDP